jgi:hypothetical protein
VRRAFIMLCLVTVAGCVRPIQPQSGVPAAPQLTRYSGEGLAFTHPAAWKPHSYENRSSFSRSIVYLSTQRLHPPCVRSNVTIGTGPETGTLITCGWPLDHLAPNSVLVEWSQHGTPTWRLDQEPGARRTIAGRAAKLHTARPGDCKTIGAEETITAYIPRLDLASNWYQMRACLRGPDLDKAQAQVRQLLTTTSLRY